MRGKAFLEQYLIAEGGITPAYAGKSHLIEFFLINIRDHPRLCGEKCKREACYTCYTGSPPPMRGKDLLESVAFLTAGITPAYAGKSSSCCRTRFLGRDHPRLCGEKDLDRWEDKLDRGITPAYAGKRSACSQCRLYIQDHPRLCGEKFLQDITGNVLRGSPPPMRGKVCANIPGHWISGITPAYAGKSECAR